MPSLGSFQDYLSAAVQLKTALIKAKPGRQEWENAPPFMRCTVAPIDSVQCARAGDFSTQFSTAMQLKEQGNELVSKDPESALERYSQAISVFLWFDRGPDKASEEVPLISAADRLQGGEKEQAHHLLAVTFCNAAACLLQLGMTADAVYACNKALKYDPYSVKALYRRALAHRQADSTAGLEAAVADLAAANQLEPANNQVRLALTALQHELREHRRNERGLYGNMFQRGQLYGDHEPGSSGNGSGGAGDSGPRAPDGAPDRDGLLAGTRLPAPSAASSHRDRGRGRGQGFASEDHDYDVGEDGEDEVGREAGDPEDLALWDPTKRKAESAQASREADLVMRRMQRTLAQTRNRRMVEQLDADRERRAARFPWWAVPWWAYALIALHLFYRVIKIWRLPIAKPTLTGAGALQEAGFEQE